MSDVETPCKHLRCTHYRGEGGILYCALLNGGDVGESHMMLTKALMWGYCPMGEFGKMTEKEFVLRCNGYLPPAETELGECN
jgi:hypothetical protein